MFAWRRDRARRSGVAAPGEAAPTPAAERARAARDRTEALVRRLEWTVIRRLDGLLQGDYRTLFRGFGLDFADLREYRPGDDVRYMDWNVTARLQTPYVREFQEDREMSAWFLLDLSASVDFGSGGVTKRELLNDFTAVMARLLTGHGNRVGAMLYTGADEAFATVVPARAGRRHMLHLLERANAVSAAPRGETRLRQLLDLARVSVGRRSAMFVVSDFISAPGWETSLGMLGRRHEVVAVRLADPLEIALPDLGLVVLQDAETGEQMFVDTHDASFRKRFSEAAQAREAGLRHALQGAGVTCLELRTDQRLDLALLDFARRRSHRGGAGGRAQDPTARALPS
ncbi:DUF58 domain-containing protein [Bordetella genomosp. 9]|uniref:DUF58 domain-containing protein n=1 Tax=Bordetella genomosp. 9 TaxID=1416803 RepID=UPI000A291A6C|nr:DUF58 domain-containing protein [Bordetella genomosp. 9]ARP90547.1 DUF58 domain-containing protein [Bordetella genomosp. 9]